MQASSDIYANIVISIFRKPRLSADESGICLRSMADQTLLVVTSANVETLAVQAPSLRDEFLPENDLSAYRYMPLEA